MSITRITILFIGLSVGFACKAQPTRDIANRAYYRTHDAGSVFLHSSGTGISYQHGWRKTGFSNRIINFELMTLRHPKEYKINRSGAQNSRGYFYGKINSAGLMRASFGWQKVLYDKEIKRGVRVSYFGLFGPSLGIIKPVYVELIPNAGEGSRSQLIRYSASVENQGDVMGRAPILYKINTLRIIPGGHAKFILNFEYASDDSYIKAIETGVNLDVFAKDIPIMEGTYNTQYYLTLFIGFQFGRRSL